MAATEMIHTYAGGTCGRCTELSGRFSHAGDVDEVYARFCQRFPQLEAIASRIAHGDANPAAVVTFIDRTYRISDPSLDVIPPQTDTGYDSWCPRESEAGLKYWDRVPINATIRVGYYNCLYATALTGRACSAAGCGFAILICPTVPTHPFIQFPGRPDRYFSFNHDGLRCYQAQAGTWQLPCPPQTLAPISDYGTKDGIYGLSIPEHFIIPARLVPEAGNVARAIAAFDGLAANLDGYPRLKTIAHVIRQSILPRLRSGPVPFTRTIEEGTPYVGTRD